MHGFLAYLMKCAMTGRPYTIYGHKGKQVRDNIHSSDLIAAIDAFFRAPRVAEVYNIGGGRDSNCSLREAIALCQEITGREVHATYRPEARLGDHRWWISDASKFAAQYPEWKLALRVPQILREIHNANRERWRGE